MKKVVVCGVYLAASALAFAQFGPGPAVPRLGQGELRPHAWVKGFFGRDAGTGPGGTVAPGQVTGAYGITTALGQGQGATVAIVDAYNGKNVAADLAYFISYFGITCQGGATGKFTIVNQTGGSTLPAYNSGWEVEINLDTQYVTAIAPCANITLVEAKSNNNSDLLAAVSYASSIANVVSMSWGGSEFSGQTSDDKYFLKTGVTFLASSGDTGGLVEWPSSSVNVIAVGGTNLTLNGNAYVSEAAWSGSGGGCSTQEPAIAAQSGFLPVSPGCTKRAVPDVAIDGGNASAVATYISAQGGWFGVYGTSLAVQLWAGVIATANGRAATPLNGTLSTLYANAAGIASSAPYATNYNDITSGTAGSFSSAAGWDFVTGLGSPRVSSLVPDLTGPNFSLSISPSSQTAAPSVATGTYTVTTTPINGFSNAVTWSYNAPSGVTVVPGASTGSSYGFTLSSATPGTYAVTITGTYGSLSHTVTATLVVTAPSFSLSISPSTQSVTRPTSSSKPATATYTVKVTPVGAFTSPIALSVTGGTTGVTPTVPGTITSPATTGTLTVTVTNSAKTGTLTLTVTGKSGSITKTATATITVTSGGFF